MKIEQLPAGFDNGMNNLMWILHTNVENEVILVDPGYGDVVKNYIDNKNPFYLKK